MLILYALSENFEMCKIFLNFISGNIINMTVLLPSPVWNLFDYDLKVTF